MRTSAATDHPVIKYVPAGEPIPPEVLELRRRTFIEERGFLSEESLTNANDLAGCHICIYAPGGGELIAATHIVAAEDSDFPHHSGIGAARAKLGAYSSRSFVHPDARYRGYFSLLMYLTMRWARMNGRPVVYGFLEEGLPPITKMLAPEFLADVPPRVVSGRDGDYRVLAAQVDVDYAMHRCFRTLSKSLKAFVCEVLIPEEISQAADAGIERFYENPWFQLVRAGRLSRRQYAMALMGLHHYVRWTTRLLARVTAETADPELRSHWLEHLSGEVDHEKMLERDLEALGWDVDYCMNESAPSPDIFAFMSIQQSIVAFERDPVLFLAVPLVAEGLSAMLASDFLASLERCVASWGLERPRAAMTFLRSHVHTDGGDHGHWQAVKHALGTRLTTEAQLQRALTVVHAIFGAQERAYAAIARYPSAARSAFAEPALTPVAAAGVVEPALETQP